MILPRDRVWSKGRWLRRMLIAMVVCVVMGACFCGAFEAYFRFRIDKERSRIRSEGYPTTLEELQALYPVLPDNENAALVLDEALRQLPEEKTEAELLDAIRAMPAETPLGDDLKKRTRELLSLGDACLQELHKAAAMPRARFPIILDEKLADAKSPHLLRVNRAMDLLWLEAVLAAEEGRGDDAVRDLLAVLNTGRLLKAEPLVMSQLFFMRGFVIGRLGAERLLFAKALDDDALQSLMEGFVGAEPAAALSRSLVALQCANLLRYKKNFEEKVNEAVVHGVLEADSLRSVWTQLSIRELVRRTLYNPNVLALLTGYRGVIEASRQPIHLRVQSAEASLRALDSWPTAWTAAARNSLFNVPAVYRGESQFVAEARITRTALAVERYRLAQGQSPERLDELVPQFLDSIPLDPFDGKPLRYRRLEEGYVVYSVGINGKDDGGSEDPDPIRKDNTLDIVFKVPR